jgi:NUMOD3 motif
MSEDRKFYVYGLFRDQERTDPFYVGKGHGDRINYHQRLLEKGKRVNHHKNNTIRQCLKRFDCVPRDVFARGLSESEAFDLERRLIAKWGRRDKGTGSLTNMTDGGEGTAGCIYTAEQRAASSALRKGKKTGPRPPQVCLNISLALTGKPKSDNHKQNLRLANLGKTQSQEARAKISVAHTGRIRSPETCAKLSAALTGRPRSQDHCANISKAKKGKRQPREVVERQIASRAITMAGKPGPNKGRVFSAGERENMRQAQLRRWALRRAQEAAHD